MREHATRIIVAGYLRALAEEGMSKAEAARASGLVYHTIERYAKDFEINFVRGKRKPGPLRVKRLGLPDIDPAEVFVAAPTVRECCVANRGKMSAAQLGAILGVTRNVVIGHWFRARQQGVIT